MKNIKKPSYALNLGNGNFAAGGKWVERTCYSHNHYCANCDGKIKYGETEWCLTYWINGHPNTEYYHECCC